jgi:nitrite reductase/ring-hydroxylating ferredoxin subunit
MATFRKVAGIDELPSGAGKCLEIDRKRIVLFNVGGCVYAIDDVCPHRGASLSEGELEGATVICPWHGAIFDLATGEVRRFPVAAGVATYEVRVDDRDISVAV